MTDLDRLTVALAAPRGTDSLEFDGRGVPMVCQLIQTDRNSAAPFQRGSRLTACRATRNATQANPPKLTKLPPE